MQPDDGVDKGPSIARHEHVFTLRHAHSFHSNGRRNARQPIAQAGPDFALDAGPIPYRHHRQTAAIQILGDILDIAGNDDILGREGPDLVWWLTSDDVKY